MAPIVSVTSPPPAQTKHPLWSHSPAQTMLVDDQSYSQNPLRSIYSNSVIASRLAWPAGEARPKPRRSGGSLQQETLVASGVSWGAGRQPALTLLEMPKTWAEASSTLLLSLTRPWEEAPEGTGPKVDYAVSPQNIPGNFISGPPKSVFFFFLSSSPPSFLLYFLPLPTSFLSAGGNQPQALRMPGKCRTTSPQPGPQLAFLPCTLSHHTVLHLANCFLSAA